MGAKANRERRKQAEEIGELVLSMGISTNEVMAILTRFKGLRKRLFQDAHGQPNIKRPTLPNEADAISESEQFEMVRRAALAGVESGFYDDWELMAFADFVAKTTRQDDIAEWRNNLLPYHLYGTVLEREINRTRGIVIGSRGELRAKSEDGKWVFPFSEKDAGEMAKYWVQLCIVAERIGVAPDDLPNPTPYVQGIRHLITGTDKGQSLIQAVNELSPPDPAIYEFLLSRRKPGPKPVKALDYLCARARPHRLAGQTWPETWDALLMEFENGTSAEEKSALAWMENGSLEALSNAYDRRENPASLLADSTN